MQEKREKRVGILARKLSSFMDEDFTSWDAEWLHGGTQLDVTWGGCCFGCKNP